MNSSLQNLLRRTMAIAGAVLAFAFAGSATAQQTVTLVGASGNTCSFSGGLSVSPAGALTITCSGATGSSTATFTLLAPSSININTTDTRTTVSRSGGTGLGTLAVSYSVSGNGCATSSGSLSFAEGSTTPQAISITTGATGATSCVVTISPPTGQVASPSSASITVVDPNGGGGGGVAGCPTQDPNALAVNISYNALPQTQATGVIGFAPVAAPQGTKSSVYFEQSIGTTTANAMHTEISVSPCPGVILTPTTQPAVASQCYVSTDYTVDNRLYIYTKPVYTWTSQAALGNRGCWAGDGKAYYVNYRWTYGGCAYGTCGFVLQWFTGPY